MERLPNLFESYEQPENKITFALLQTLAADNRLGRVFIRWATPGLPAVRGPVAVYSQKKPAAGRGIRASDPELDPTIPDGWLAAGDLLVALEVKRDPGTLRGTQLNGHLRALAHREATHRALLVLTPDASEPGEVSALKDAAEAQRIRVYWRAWREVHAWTCDQITQTDTSRDKKVLPGTFLLRRFREYMEMSELSGFAGLVFDEGYDYRRAKAILKTLRQEIAPEVLRVDRRLKNGRGHITDDATLVWDVFAPRANFTDAPHFTLSISEGGASLHLTIPDKARQAWRTLAHLALEQTRLERTLKDSIVTILRVQTSRRPTVQFNLKQRHWETRGRPSAMDARLVARFDTTPLCPSSLRARGIREREGWYRAILALLTKGKGRANWEFQISTHWDLALRVTATPHLKVEMVRVLKAFKPLYQLVSSPS